MSTTYAISTKFLAVDKFSSTVNKMNKTTSSLTGTLAKLGVAVSGIAIGKMILDANIQAEKSFASLSAITGVTGSELDNFKEKAAGAAEQTGMFVGDFAKAMALVGSKKPELLKSADALTEVTKAALTLSRAGGDEFEATAENLTGIMNQFQLGSEQANRSINVLAAGFVYGSSSISKTSEALQVTGAIASNANMSLEQTVAVMEILSARMPAGSESGTGFRNVLLALEKAGYGFESGIFNLGDALDDVHKKLNSLSSAHEKSAYLINFFGKRGANTAQILLDSGNKYKDVAAKITGTQDAYKMAEKNMSTLAFQANELKEQFLNLMTTTDKNNAAMNIMHGTLKILAGNLVPIISIIGGIAAVWGTYTIATSLATIATAAFTGALVLNPVGLIAVGVLALAAGLYEVVQHWKSWGSAVIAVGYPITIIVSLIKSLYDNWDALSASWENDSLFTFFDKLSAVIMDSLYNPIQGFLELLAKIPGMASIMAPAINSIKNMRINMGINPMTGKLLEKGQFMQGDKLMHYEKRPRLDGAFINPDAAKNNSYANLSNTNNIFKPQKLDISVSAEAGTTATVEGSKNLKAKVSSTTAFKR